MTDNENKNDAFGKACAAAAKKLYCHRDHLVPVVAFITVYLIGLGGQTVTTITSVLAGVVAWQLMTRSQLGTKFRDNAARDRALFPVRDTVRTSLSLAGVGDDLKVSVSYNAAGIAVEVVPPPGVADAVVTDRSDALASDLKAWRVTPIKNDRHGVARFQVHMNDPLVSFLENPWPLLPVINAGPLQSADPIPLAIDEAGNVVCISFWSSSLLLAGLPRHGKSVALWEILTAAAADPSAHLTVVDLKRGVELAAARERADVFCKTADEALAALNRLMIEVVRRLDLMLATEARKIKKNDPDFPALWLFIDEMAELYVGTSRDENQRAQEIQSVLVRLMSLAPAAGLIVICATQRPSVESLGGSEARSRFSYRWTMRVGDQSSAVMALGEAAIEKGADPVNLPPAPAGAGLGYMATDTGDVVRARSWYLDDDTIADLMRICAARRRVWLAVHAPPIPEPEPEQEPAPAAAPAPSSDDDLEVEPDWAPTNLADLLDAAENETPKPRRRRRRPTQKEDSQ